MISDNNEGFESMREYLRFIEKRGLLQRIDGADWNLEIGALTETVAFHDNDRALLFDNVEGYPEGKRVATNMYINEQLQAIALGLPQYKSGVGLVEEWRYRMEDFARVEPRQVADGPITENVMDGDDVDIFEFPVPLWHDHDGGRYFGTGDGVITRDPEDDWVNLAPYRVQAYDKATLGIYVNPVHHGRVHMQKYWSRGEDAPIIITGGQSPDVYAAGCAQLPEGYPELEFAGGLRGEPVEVIKHERTGLPVPANAEIAVIGRVPPPEEESRQEGPFGECTGYYAGVQELPVVHVEEIWYRDDPILQGNPTMQGSAMRHALGAEIVSSARIWESVEDDIPSIQGLYTPYQQCQAGSDVSVISIRQEYPGHAKQAAVEVLGAHPNVIMNSMVITVDEDIDPANTDEVLFAVTTRCDPAEDIDIVNGLPSIELDPRIHPDRKEAGDLTSSSMLIDACKPYHWIDRYPRTNDIGDERREEMIEKWNIDDWE